MNPRREITPAADIASFMDLSGAVVCPRAALPE
jgi:hypothetical protein